MGIKSDGIFSWSITSKKVFVKLSHSTLYCNYRNTRDFHSFISIYLSFQYIKDDPDQDVWSCYFVAVILVLVFWKWFQLTIHTQFTLYIVNSTWPFNADHTIRFPKIKHIIQMYLLKKVTKHFNFLWMTRITMLSTIFASFLLRDVTWYWTRWLLSKSV